MVKQKRRDTAIDNGTDVSKVRIEFLLWLADTLGAEGKNHEVVLEANVERDKTVRDLFNQLALSYPQFGQRVFDTKDQKLSELVSVFFNGQPLELANGLKTKLNTGDTLTLVPPLGGG